MKNGRQDRIAETLTFIKSLQNLPSAFVFLILVEEVLRMKGG